MVIRRAIIRYLLCCLLLNLVSCYFLAAYGATYYMRADGKADKKIKANSCASTYTAMSVKTHNKENFQPGDTINLCDNGGEYKTTIVVPSSGTDEKPITYTNADGGSPVIDHSMVVGGLTGWVDLGNGVYQTKGYGRVLWEDDVPLKPASSESLSDGSWYYPIGSYKLYYRPTSGKPADHSIHTIWFGGPSLSPNGIDLRNRSNITVHGITLSRIGAGIVHGCKKTSPAASIKNIAIHHNTFNRCMRAIWSQLYGNGVESDVHIYDNRIEYCNNGISAWVGSDGTPGHTQHHTQYHIIGNKILSLNSISDTLMWSDALLRGYSYKDHEGISFQDVRDSIIEGNVITTAFRKDMTSSHYWTRAIYLFLTNGDSATSGNSILRNYISGHFHPSIYISTAKGHEGLENNIIAYNVLYYGLPDKDHISFELNSASDNLLTGANYFVNNTIVNSSTGLGVWIKNHKNGNWFIRNNIVKSPKIVSISTANNKGNLVFDHNIYPVVDLGTGWRFQVGRPGVKFITWVGKYQYDRRGSSIVDPLFISPKNDFHLHSDSPAIDAGLPVGMIKDHDGVPISGKPDIGAYEFQPTTTKLIDQNGLK